MDTFIQEYDIEFSQFQDIIIKTNSLVAGSSALAQYLKQEGVEYSFVPNDIDIFINGQDNKDSMVTFLKKLGYIIGPKFNDTSYITSDYKNMTGIECVLSFINNNEKEIQLIVLENDSDVHEFIYCNFDLSCCVTWWNAENNRFATIDAEHTLKKEMYFIMPFLEIKNEGKCLDSRSLNRLCKYITRGFTNIKAPLLPLTLNETDTKTDIYLCKPNKLTGKIAFDTWCYDEVDCCTFISQSPWNIIMCIGDQYFAFHRDNIFKYMKEHTIRVPHIGLVYNTPYKQTIIEEAFYMVLYEDYTIYELVSAYTTISTCYQPTQISMYTVKCYTVAQWTSGIPGLIISPPDKSLQNNIVGESQLQDYSAEDEYYYATEELTRDYIVSQLQDYSAEDEYYYATEGRLREYDDEGRLREYDDESYPQE